MSIVLETLAAYAIVWILAVRIDYGYWPVMQDAS